MFPKISINFLSIIFSTAAAPRSRNYFADYLFRRGEFIVPQSAGLSSNNPKIVGSLPKVLRHFSACEFTLKARYTTWNMILSLQ